PGAGAVDPLQARAVDLRIRRVAEIDVAQLAVEAGRVFGRPHALGDKAQHLRLPLHAEAGARSGCVECSAHPVKTLAGARRYGHATRAERKAKMSISGRSSANR